MNIIIQQNFQKSQIDPWLFEIKQSITQLNDLFTYLDLDLKLISPSMQTARKDFALKVPLPYLKRIRKGDPNDPLLLQVLADSKELNHVAGFTTDPLDEQHNQIPMLLHKYKNRALLMFKTACAIHCRYCFRRHFPYPDNQSNKKTLLNALDYIQQNTQLDEIILSGGDPMMAKDQELDFLLTQLEAMPHIQRLRIHSRLVVAIPSRITDFLCARFQQSRLKIILVTHINHPNEIDDDVIQAMNKLKQAQVTLLNQAVLLKNVNDNVETLKQLSLALFDQAGILPYYLHLLDKVAGAAHFYVDDEQAKQIMQQLSAELSGFLLPTLVREVGGESHKRHVGYE